MKKSEASKLFRQVRKLDLNQMCSLWKWITMELGRNIHREDANQIAHGVVAKAERLTRQGQVPPKLKAQPSTPMNHAQNQSSPLPKILYGKQRSA